MPVVKEMMIVRLNTVEDLKIKILRLSKNRLLKGENPLAVFQSPSLKTTITMETPTISEQEESTAIAPDEGKKPKTILNDIYCEEMAHPHLFPTGRFGDNGLKLMNWLVKSWV